MFRESIRHVQCELLRTVATLPKHMKALLEKSWAAIFRKRIFCKIDEKKFSVLFSKKQSRPNFPINIYVGLEIMKQLFNWSDEELLSHFHFDLQVCYALGIENLGQVSLSPRTIYYNRKRIVDYAQDSGVNLFEEVFHETTLAEIKALGIDTSVQRMDSSLLSSNIKKMSRLELVIKVLQNFYHQLPEAERTRHSAKVKDYVDSDADLITFRLKNSELDEHLGNVGELLLYFRTLYQNHSTVATSKSFRHVERVLDEQFIDSSEDTSSVRLKPPAEISSDSLQNPADEDATYRRNKNTHHHGYSINIAETCSEDNNGQLITDISVHPNNTSDEQILEQRIGGLKQRTGVKEMVVDGGYSGDSSEQACEEQEVDLIFTGIKGAKVSPETLGLHHFDLTKNGIESCPEDHSPISEKYTPATGRHVVHFDKEHCSHCPKQEQCCVQQRKKFTTLYFTDQQLRVARRRQRFTEEDYRAKQKLRPALEGTVSLFKRRTSNGKLPVRGWKRVRNVIILTALAINFRRIVTVVDELFCFLFNLPKKSFGKVLLATTNIMRGAYWVTSFP
jgi:hypothetical protein